MTVRFPALAACAVFGCCIVSWPATVRAQYAVGVDGALTKHRDHDQWGGLVDGRVGFRFGLPREFILHSIICQPELIAGYRSLPWADANAFRFGAGARIGVLLDGLEPFVFGHMTAAEAEGGWGYVGDFGAALDYRLPTWSFGYHYAREWLHTAGLHSAFDEFGLHLELRGFWF